jgi:RecB family exonuclease
MSTTSQHSLKLRNPPSFKFCEDDDDAELPGTSQGSSTQRSLGKSTGKRKPPQALAAKATSEERRATAEVRELKAELAKARADAAAAVALAAEREPSGLGGSVDRLRSRAYLLYLY